MSDVGFSGCLYLLTIINRVKSESDSDYYSGQWVIRVSDADPISTLPTTKQDPAFI